MKYLTYAETLCVGFLIGWVAVHRLGVQETGWLALAVLVFLTVVCVPVEIYAYRKQQRKPQPYEWGNF